MYNYDKLWEIMKKQKKTKYYLRKYHGIPKSTLDRLKKNKNVEVYTLDKFCTIFECNFGDIIDYVPDDASKEN